MCVLYESLGISLSGWLELRAIFWVHSSPSSLINADYMVFVHFYVIASTTPCDTSTYLIDLHAQHSSFTIPSPLVFPTRSYVWEILNLTIRKMSQHVHKLTVESSEARARLHQDSEDSDSEGERRAAHRADRPSDEQVERMEERLEQAQSDQKTLFLIIFQVRGDATASCCCQGLF